MTKNEENDNFDSISWFDVKYVGLPWQHHQCNKQNFKPANNNRNAVFSSNHPKKVCIKYRKRTYLHCPINLQFRHPTTKLLVQNPYLTLFSKFYRMVLLKPPYTPDINVELRNAGAAHVMKTLTCLKSTLNKGGRGRVRVSLRYL